MAGPVLAALMNAIRTGGSTFGKGWSKSQEPIPMSIIGTSELALLKYVTDEKKKKAGDNIGMLSSNESDTIDALIKADFKESDIPAIMGNISVETGGTFDHLQKEKGGKGHGLFQLTGKQLKDYKKWLGKSEDSKYHQALFVYSNIYSSSANSPHDIGWKARGMLQDSFDNKISTPMALSPEARDRIQTSSKTKTFSDVYERPGVPHMDRRLKEAHKYRGMLSE